MQFLGEGAAKTNEVRSQVLMCVRSISAASLCILGFSIASCQEAQNGEMAASESCYVELGAERRFLGEPRCLAALDSQELDGFWIVGFEYSVFFESLDDLRAGAIPRGYSLQLSSDIAPNRQEFYEGYGPTIYRVRFEGSITEEPGFYAGGYDDLRGGALVQEFYEIEEIALDDGAATF